MTSYFNNLPEAIPARFESKPVKRAPKAIREWQIIEPSTQGPYNKQNKKITFNLTKFGICDFRRGFLGFNAVFTSTGGTYRRCHNGIWTMIDRIVISQAGSGDIEIAPQYGRYAHLDYISNREVDVDSYMGASLWGIGDAAARNALAPGADYGIPLINGFFNIEPLDLTKLAGQLQIDIYLNDPVNFMEYDGSAADYSVTNLQLWVEKLQFNSTAVESMAIKNRNTWKMVSWRDYTANYNTPGSNWNLIIDHKTNSVDGFTTIIQASGALTNPATNNRLETFLKNNVASYQPNINGLPVPSRPIDTARVPGYIAYLTTRGKWDIHGNYNDPPVITRSDYDSTKFIVAYDFRAFPYSPQLVNPMNFAEASTSLNVNFSTGSAAPSTTNFNHYTFVNFEQLLSLSDGMFKTVF